MRPRFTHMPPDRPGRWDAADFLTADAGIPDRSGTAGTKMPARHRGRAQDDHVRLHCGRPGSPAPLADQLPGAFGLHRHHIFPTISLDPSPIFGELCYVTFSSLRRDSTVERPGPGRPARFPGIPVTALRSGFPCCRVPILRVRCRKGVDSRCQNSGARSSRWYRLSVSPSR